MLWWKWGAKVGERRKGSLFGPGVSPHTLCADREFYESNKRTVALCVRFYMDLHFDICNPAVFEENVLAPPLRLSRFREKGDPVLSPIRIRKNNDRVGIACFVKCSEKC